MWGQPVGWYFGTSFLDVGDKHVPGARREARPRSALVPACGSRASETLQAHNPPNCRGAYRSEGCAVCLEELALWQFLGSNEKRASA